MSVISSEVEFGEGWKIFIDLKNEKNVHMEGNKMYFKKIASKILQTYVVCVIYFGGDWKKIVCTNGSKALFLLNADSLAVEGIVTGILEPYRSIWVQEYVDDPIGSDLSSDIVTNFHSDDVNNLIIWNEKDGIFLTACDDKQVRAYKIQRESPKIDFVKIVVTMESDVDQLVKVSDERFLIFLEVGFIFVASYDNNKIVKKLGHREFNWWVRPVLSKYHSHSVYVNLMDKEDNSKSPVILVNYEKDKDRFFYCEEESYTSARSMDIFHRNEEEILVIGTTDKRIIFFNTSLSDPKKSAFMTQIYLHPKFDFCECLRIISSCFTQYLCFVAMDGYFGLIDISSKSYNFEKSILVDFSSEIDCIYDLKTISRTPTSIVMAVSGYNKTVKTFEIGNLELYGGQDKVQERKDEVERTNFLKDGMEEFFSSQQKELGIFRIRIIGIGGGEDPFRILRSFLLL